MTNVKAKPKAKNAPKVLFTFLTIIAALTKNDRNKKIINPPPIKPYSSKMMAKIKSE